MFRLPDRIRPSRLVLFATDACYPKAPHTTRPGRSPSERSTSTSRWSAPTSCWGALWPITTGTSPPPSGTSAAPSSWTRSLPWHFVGSAPPTCSPAITGEPDEQLYIAHAAAIQASAGNRTRAVELFGRLDAAAQPAAYYRAMVLAALGDHDGAFRELDRSTDLRESLLVQVGVIPSFDVLHRDPRFDDVLTRVGLRR